MEADELRKKLELSTDKEQNTSKQMNVFRQSINDMQTQIEELKKSAEHANNKAHDKDKAYNSLNAK